MRIVVIGAGPAGMTAALQFSRAGASVDVFEAGECVGGLARTIKLWGQRVDLGPHRFFSTDPRVNSLWLDVVGTDYAMVQRLTRIFFNQQFFDYPLRPLNACGKLGLPVAIRCVASYVKEQVLPQAFPTADETFETWVVRRFGRRLFETFFRTYSEKLWGIPCTELSADFAAQRINTLTLADAIKSALSLEHRKRHKTLVDRFAYPLAGTGSVYEKMAVRLREQGGRIHLEAPVRRLIHDGYEVRGLELETGQRIDCDLVVSTMPLTRLVRGLTDVPPAVRAAADGLRFRNTILVYLHVDCDSLFDDQWLYIHDPQLRMGRVTNFRNWVPQLVGESRATILAVEYWCNHSDPMWIMPEEDLIGLASREMRATGLLLDQPITAGHVIRVPRCYPVYQRGYRQLVDRIADYLRTFRRLIPIGRYGTFKYNNQDHSILMGILAAENALGNGVHDLWSINTDYESYQERALITETGLSPAQTTQRAPSDLV